jgi:hypothetical protein
MLLLSHHRHFNRMASCFSPKKNGAHGVCSLRSRTLEQVALAVLAAPVTRAAEVAAVAITDAAVDADAYVAWEAGDMTLKKPTSAIGVGS